MKTVPVEKYQIVLGSGPIDERQALEGWELIVRSQGCTPVGEPEIIRDEFTGFQAVIGKLVRIQVDAKIDPSVSVVNFW